MITAIILVFVGLLLVFLEFFLPGGVMGIAGAIVVIGAMVLFAMQSESIVATIVFIGASVVAVGLLIRYALWRIKNSNPDYSVYSNGDQAGYYASEHDTDAVGKKAVVLTDLRPGGYILLEGKRVQAISKSGYIAKGAEVEVINGEEESLIVKEVK